jgi:hypothetical protein
MLLILRYVHQVHCTYGIVSFGAAVVATDLDTCKISKQRLSGWNVLQLVM